MFWFSPSWISQVLLLVLKWWRALYICMYECMYTRCLQEERDAEDARIAGLRGTDLVAAMRDGTLTSERAVAAFCRRASAIGNVKTKGVTEEFYDEAVEAARIVDEGAGACKSGTMGVAAAEKLRLLLLLLAARAACSEGCPSASRTP